MTSDLDNDGLRALAKATRYRADIVTNGRAFAGLSFALWEDRNKLRPIPQVDAEELHEALIRARLCHIENLQLAYERQDPAGAARAQWERAGRRGLAPSLDVIAIDRYQSELRVVWVRDRQLLRLVAAWERDQAEASPPSPLYLHHGLIAYMRECLSAYGAAEVPRAAPEAIVTRTAVQDFRRGAIRALAKDERHSSAEREIEGRLLEAIRKHPGSSAGALEKILGVKNGTTAASLARLLAPAARVENRGTRKRPQYYVIS